MGQVEHIKLKMFCVYVRLMLYLLLFNEILSSRL
jgi:hypothetical protein